MSSTFFTSDTHFGHENIMKYCRRDKFMTPEEVADLVVGVREGSPVFLRDVAQVSAESSTSLARQLGDMFMFKEGADTNPENYSSFLVSRDAVTFIFQQYQVAAYAAGPQRVSFPRIP